MTPAGWLTEAKVHCRGQRSIRKIGLKGFPVAPGPFATPQMAMNSVVLFTARQLRKPKLRMKKVGRGRCSSFKGRANVNGGVGRLVTACLLFGRVAEKECERE